MNNSLENYFTEFRKNIIGINKIFTTPYGEKKIIYADWVASGRLYKPIEIKIMEDFGPFVGNTHTETTVTGTLMTKAYHRSHEILKEHVNAGKNDIIITSGAGMTGVINKFQRILGLKICKKFDKFLNFPDKIKPVVFLTHMEHHSNQTTWLETICKVEIIKPTEDGRVDLNYFEDLCRKYRNEEIKIASVTACSNVTGIQTPLNEIAEIIHKYSGLCFVDYACSAPYVNIDMHPEKEENKLDAIYFSPHKFLGGPGSTGVLIFDSSLYNREIPDQPGGGTVAWTNPWKQHVYFDNIEIREDGGTPGFLQSIRASLAVKLKEDMKVENILQREEELLPVLFGELKEIKNLHILQENIEDRLGVISFYIENLHFNLGVKILNDYYGIQARGGCSCAGTYGHYLLHLSKSKSKEIMNKVDLGNLSEKPGWMRISIHPTMTDEEIYFILNAIKELAENHRKFEVDYIYNSHTNEFTHINKTEDDTNKIKSWFLF